MKKTFLFAAIAAFALTGCSNDSEAPGGTDATTNPVSFRVSMDKVDTNKAAEASSTTITSFSAFAFTTDNASTPVEAINWDFMNENAVTRTQTNTWAPAKSTYWPTATEKKTKVSFVCYSPAGARNISTGLTHPTAGTAPSLVYKVPETEQVDFLAGATVVTATSNVFPTAAITIPLKHALAMIKFQAKNTSPSTTFVITAIKLLNFHNAGKLSITPGTNTLGWATQGTADGAFSNYAASIPVAGVSVVGEPVATATAKLITTDNEGIMIIPQDISVPSNSIPATPATANATDGMWVSVTYYWIDGNGITKPSKTEYYPLSTAVTSTFAKTTKYLYTITFNAGTIVDFTVPSFTDWNSDAPAN